jgi:hypothetical protein
MPDMGEGRLALELWRHQVGVDAISLRRGAVLVVLILLVVPAIEV